MLSHHAASRAVTITGLRFSSSGSSASTSKTPYDVRFLRSFIRAALHGHSPSYKRRGWKSSGTKHGRASPYSYLSRDLVDKDLTHTHEKGGVRIFEQDGHERPRTFKIDPDRDRRPSSSKSRKGKGRAAIQSRSYATQASESLEDVGSDQESDFGVDNDLEADNLETSPKEASRDVPSAIEKRDRQLKPGDWIQVSLYVVVMSVTYCLGLNASLIQIRRLDRVHLCRGRYEYTLYGSTGVTAQSWQRPDISSNLRCLLSDTLCRLDPNGQRCSVDARAFSA